jgi:short chain dehydrogenase
MRQQRAGHIINFSSLGGFRASAGWGIYCSTKFAVEGITDFEGHSGPMETRAADGVLGWVSAIISPISSSGPYNLNLLRRYLAD